MALFSIVTRHRSYARALGLATPYLRNPRRFWGLLEKAQAKAEDGSYIYVNALENALTLPLRMLRAYISGEYRQLPWRSLTMLTAAVIYFLLPFDFITDLLPLIGLMDDIGVLAWTLRQLQRDVDRFEAWERSVALGIEAGASATGTALAQPSASLQIEQGLTGRPGE